MRGWGALGAVAVLAACGDDAGPEPVLCDGVRDGDEAVVDAAFDHDGDGYVDGDERACVAHHALTDCDDADPGVHPGAAESCNGIDDDCDGEVDEPGAIGGSVAYVDDDGDGYGDADAVVLVCAPTAGLVDDATDCDDGDADVHIGAPEVCNGADDDCDGAIDEEATAGGSTWFLDADDDGYGTPDVTTVACVRPDGYVADPTDCDDGDRAVNPDADERCDGQDDDCDGTIDEAGAAGEERWYLDADGDGYGLVWLAVEACATPEGYAAVYGDCDDLDAAVHPGGTEACNGADDDCDGVVDDGLPTVPSYPDIDRDGYGVGFGEVHQCGIPPGYTLLAGDCGPRDGAVHPGAPEVCNGLDDDCDGGADDDDPDGPPTLDRYVDADGDGDGAGSPVSATGCALASGYAWTGTDCDDADPDVRGYTAYVDADGDGYGAGRGVPGCGPVAGVVTVAGDCDDAASDAYPGAPETCTDPDLNCDGAGCDLLVALHGDAEEFERVGISCTAGDLTGDGVTDLVVGRPYNAGRAVTVYAGPVGEHMEVITGLVAAEDYHHELGSVVGVVDLDDDGAPDLVAGPYRRWLGVYAGPLDGTLGSDETLAAFVGPGDLDHISRATALLDGEVDALVVQQYGDGVWVIPTGIPTTDDVERLAEASIVSDGSSRVATKMSTGFDWDGDGLDDVAVNQLGPDPRTPGTVVAVAPGPLSGTYVWDDLPVLIDGGRTDPYHGQTLTFAPDLDGDGYAELVVGGGDTVQFYQNVPAGRWHGHTVASYALEGLDSSWQHTIAVGDFDGDGQPDLAMGDYGGGRAQGGTVDVYLGPLGADFSPDDASAHWESDLYREYLGYRMVPVSDPEGAGRDSLLISASGTDEGTIYLLLGSQLP